LNRIFLLALVALLALAGPAPAASRATTWPTHIGTASTQTTQLAKPAGIDLDVTYISRAPLYSRYDVLYTGAGTPYLRPGSEQDKRWPAPGELVTFTAHVANKGTLASGGFAFKWYVDDVEVSAGTLPSLAAGQTTTATYKWVWAHQADGERLLGQHSVRFAVDPANAIGETYETNNSLQDRTDALSLVLAVTPQLYAALETPIDPQWPFSAEDWLQKQVAAMNGAFARSTYPAALSGITERVRLEGIVVAPSQPPASLAVDGMFFMQQDDRFGNSYYDPATDVSGGLIHELSHQLGLIDMYNLDVPLEALGLRDRSDQPVQMEYMSAMRGLMNDPGIRPPSYDEHSALALNANRGYRRGYYGEYLYDVPAVTSLRILDTMGAPAAGVTARLYQRISDGGPLGKGSVDDTAEIVGLSDAGGIVTLANRPAGSSVTTRTGHTLHDNPFGPIDVVGRSGAFVVELTRGTHQEYMWLDITQFNLAAWRGSSTIQLLSHVPAATAPAAPSGLTGRQENGQVALTWQPSAGPHVAGYNVYRAGGPAWKYQRVASYLTTPNYSETYDASARAAVYAVTAVDVQGRESGFSNLFNAFRLQAPAGVVVDDQNQRVVLDPQNGYALLSQRPNGTFADVMGGVDYHLEYSGFIARDARGRLMISHPGDEYSDRHSVRVADAQGWPAFEFGTRGSAPGQFENPAGVAVWEQPCTTPAPYALDAQTRLLLHFDGGVAGVQGQVGSATGTTFAAGKYDQGVQIDGADTLTYPAQGNINRTRGTVEFWFRPAWAGGDGQSYTLFEIGAGWFNRMRIMKDGANNLRFMVWDSSHEYGAGYNVAGWQPGEWHHIAALWDNGTITLAVDGEVRASNPASPPDALADTIYIGSTQSHDQQAGGVFDELRISDSLRPVATEACPYRILVADSGNNRIQAFDAAGRLISAYGQAGTGPGQFDNPQGLAVDASGRVIVADSGNNRLQTLDFDGTHFSFVRSITGGFDRPVGVVAYRDKLVVADTGAGKVKILGAAGGLVAEYSGPNDGRDGVFSRPRGVAIDKAGTIVVADTGNGRVVTIRDALDPVGPANLVLGGPSTGTTEASYTFDAAVLPINATWPLSYTWQASGLAPVQHSASTTDTATFSWATPGIKTVSVTVKNAAGAITSTTQIRISAPAAQQKFYIPFVKR
jgi:hypothetical protein